MNILVAVDSFKGSLSSLDAGQAIAEGIKNASDSFNVEVLPVADGGEGTYKAIGDYLDGEFIELYVTDSLGNKIKVEYSIINSGGKYTAVIETAQACGLPDVPNELRNPLYTTTYGLGEMILDAIKKGCRNFIIGLGGSSTNDCGIGMLQALGYKFLDDNTQNVGYGGINLEKIRYIDPSNANEFIPKCNFRIACDVDNPLYGKNGAAYIYAPQKGATPEIVEKLDSGMKSFSNLCAHFYGEDISSTPGCGAAGGLGFAFMRFLNTKLESGIKIVLDEIEFEKHIKNCDIVVTGEGRMDNQTAMGKAPAGITEIAQRYGKKVIAIAGSLDDDISECNKIGIISCFSSINKISTLDEALNKDNAYRNLVSTTTQIFRLINELSN